MSSTWDELTWGPWPGDAEVPHEGPDAVTRERLGLPATLRPVPGALQRPVFDPALKQYPKAMRAGEPLFASAETGEQWYAARRRAVDHVLAAIAQSRWAEHLVLRGSVLLRAWYGDAAREPGDLDFVVVPRSWQMAEHRTREMLDGIAQAAEAMSDEAHLPDDVQLNAAGAVSEDIWTYDRVPGRRLVLPWKAEGLPQGTVQLDFVFNEHLPAEPELTEIPRYDGGEPALLQAASPELSLAWKVMWLLDDIYPQGKDLYDAWLLAQDTRLGYRLLVEAMVAGDPARVRHLPTLADVGRLEVDWEEFHKEYPGLPGTGEDYHYRLTSALTPTFTSESDLPEQEYVRRAELLRPRTAMYEILRAERGIDGALRAIADDRIPIAEGVVIANELLGRGPSEVAATLDQVLRAYESAGSGWIGYLRRNPDEQAKILADLRDGSGV
ncbi:nucleotidyl transferase AbiEii/AbiGii toxin family protein [Actinomadura rudentiformis]|uniref:Nucleotidyl transferase AbiEii/AbiGii toxin family protein n=1 Tax=Actinomadura rudentiformis TaxID=359158 RepID=A0A6H9Y8A6_9ACTN|nr:nucleotidyl transferase AbiEii/AbiGii toxin family protein [Actinomadura rudentiformis]KAB2339346.1 nucleotidyl transferase AbiEii/AbiGii toxin family protein [Actinomadura rudentiformis]